jgi:hypothetical protein
LPAQIQLFEKDRLDPFDPLDQGHHLAGMDRLPKAALCKGEMILQQSGDGSLHMLRQIVGVDENASGKTEKEWLIAIDTQGLDFVARAIHR